ncbi:MAG: hydrogenase maturation nickel metallochaperone HypA/HybF [Hyphomicrobium sp.]
MHELSITRSIVAIVAEHAGGRRVNRVTLEIGALSAVMPEAVRFCFDVVAKGTALEGAELDIVRVDAIARCRTCGAEFEQLTLFSPCACGSRDSARLSGEDLKIRSYEFVSTAADKPRLGEPVLRQ